MKIRIDDLTGPALDWAVATALGYKGIRVFGRSQPRDRGWIEVRFNPEPKAGTARFDPSDNWDFAGPIIYRERIGLTPTMDDHVPWVARVSGSAYSYGDKSPMVAAMRAIVARKLGEEENTIDIPDGLV
jgi:hypothetical protein